jgi:type II secretory pathway component PulF
MAFEITDAISDAPAPASAAAAPGRLPRLALPSFARSFGVRERMAFTEQLALLLDTGVSLHEALTVLQQQSVDPKLAAMLQSMFDDLAEGKPFSAALSRHPEMFSQSYVSLVAAAEEGGFLQQVLQQLLEIDEKNSRLQGVVTAALSYPAFLVVFSVAVVVFVLTVIVPKFQDLFESIRNDLPLATVVLMAVSDFLAKHWLATLAALGAALSGVWLWARTPRGAWLIDDLKIRVPFVGGIFTQVYLNQTLNVLGLALLSGVPVTAALKAAQEVIPNRRFARFLESVREEVNNGRGIAAGFQAAPFIPPMVREMIATGERTGELGKVMMRISDFYGRELNRRIGIVAKVAEPFMLVVMGVVVGLLVAALILPIFKLSRGMH